MFAGTPEDMLKAPILKKSVTAQFLKDKMQ
jgi:hypothetical protein